MKTREASLEVKTFKCARRISRRRLLRIGGASVAGATFFGFTGCGGSDSGAETGSGADTRTFEHALGKAKIPADPRRVVTIDPYASLQTALAVGAPIVGSPTFPGEPFPDFLSEKKTAEIESLGYDQPSIEKISALNPDLIVGWVDWIEYHEIYDELSRIAPTVAVESGYDWKENSRAVADVLNRRDELEDQIADYEARIEGFKEAMSDRLDGLTVSVVKPREDVLEVFTNRFYAGHILQEAGVRRPENQMVDDPRKISLELSLELIPRADADVMFLMVGGGGEDEKAARDSLRRFESSPLWKRLRAVRDGRMYEVDPNAWFITSGPQAANVVLDDLNEYLLEGRNGA